MTDKELFEELVKLLMDNNCDEDDAVELASAIWYLLLPDKELPDTRIKEEASERIHSNA